MHWMTFISLQMQSTIKCIREPIHFSYFLNFPISSVLSLPSPRFVFSDLYENDEWRVQWAEEIHFTYSWCRFCPFIHPPTSSSFPFQSRISNLVHVICLNVFTDCVRHSFIGRSCCCCSNTHGHFNRQYSALPWRQNSCLHPGPGSTSTINWTCHFFDSLNGAIRTRNEHLQLIVVGINLIIEKWREKKWVGEQLKNGIESSSCFKSKICCPLERRVLSGGSRVEVGRIRANSVKWKRKEGVIKEND